MKLILETERLIMRPFLKTDNESMFIMDSNPNVHQYLGKQPLIEITQCDEYIKNIQKQYIDHGIGRFTVVVKETNEIIGWAGIKFITESENNHINFYDIGYRFAEAYWGKGYGYEAAKAWLDYGFNEMNIPAIYASAHIDNIGSNKILQKIGLEQKQQYLHYNLPCYWYELKNNNSKT